MSVRVRAPTHPSIRQATWACAARCLATLVVAIAGLISAPAARAQEHPHADNSGQDPTNPVTRIDVRLKYQDLPGKFQAETFTLRADKPFALGDGWKLSTRIDLPFSRSDVITPLENSDGGYELGISDTLIQALLVTPPKGKVAYAFGAQLIIPTGSDDQFTTGKWQLVPSAGIVYQLPEISRGTFVGLVVRDAFSFAGKDSREDINVLSLQPIFNWQGPNRWFVTLAPEAKFNTRDDWKLFLPVDITVGRKLNATTVASLQADVALINEYEQYDWQVEARLGFFF